MPSWRFTNRVADVNIAMSSCGAIGQRNGFLNRRLEVRILSGVLNMATPLPIRTGRSEGSLYASVAQLAERRPSKSEAMGSNPITRSHSPLRQVELEGQSRSWHSAVNDRDGTPSKPAIFVRS